MAVTDAAAAGQRVASRKRRRSSLRLVRSVPALRLLTFGFSRIHRQLLMNETRLVCSPLLSNQMIEDMRSAVLAEPWPGFQQSAATISFRPQPLWVWMATCLCQYLEIVPRRAHSGHRAWSQFRNRYTGSLGWQAFEDATGVSRRTWRQFATHVQSDMVDTLHPRVVTTDENVALAYLQRLLEKSTALADGRSRRALESRLRQMDRKGGKSEHYRRSILGTPYGKRRMRVSVARPVEAHLNANDLCQKCQEDIDRRWPSYAR